MSLKTTDMKKTITDKYATFSMPGSIRKAKTSLFGVSRMPDDPLAYQRNELDEYEGLINTLMTVASSIQTAVEMLATAPQAMYEPLQRFYPEEVGGRAMVERLCMQLGEFSQQARAGDCHVENMRKTLQEISKQNTEIKAAFTQRDIAHQTHTHYMGKVDSLQEQIAKGGASAKLVEKLNRNVQKRKSGEETLHSALSELGVQVSDILAAKWHRLSGAISHLCKYYAVVFEASSHLVQDFHEVGDALVLTTTSEAMMRRGQELAAQAKEKLSTFASDFKQKATEANHMAAAAVSNATANWAGCSPPGSHSRGPPPGHFAYSPGYTGGTGDTACGMPPSQSSAGGPPQGWPTWPHPGAGGPAPMMPQTWAPPTAGQPSDPFLAGGYGHAATSSATRWGSMPPPSTKEQAPKSAWEKMAQAAPKLKGKTPWA